MEFCHSGVYKAGPSIIESLPDGVAPGGCGWIPSRCMVKLDEGGIVITFVGQIFFMDWCQALHCAPLLQVPLLQGDIVGVLIPIKYSIEYNVTPFVKCQGGSWGKKSTISADC